MYCKSFACCDELHQWILILAVAWIESYQYCSVVRAIEWLWEIILLWKLSMCFHIIEFESSLAAACAKCLFCESTVVFNSSHKYNISRPYDEKKTKNPPQLFFWGCPEPTMTFMDSLLPLNQLALCKWPLGVLVYYLKPVCTWWWELLSKILGCSWNI